MAYHAYFSHVKALSEEYIKEAFARQRSAELSLGATTARERIDKIKALAYAVKSTYRQQIRDALYADLHKGKEECDLTEVYMVTTEAQHTIAHLERWMRPHTVPTPLPLLGSSSQVRYESKGLSLIISPWNFPINLTLGPLISAIAAGCPVMIKPSEYTPHTTEVIQLIITDLFLPTEVMVCPGAIDTAEILLSLPFRHIFFTGSPAVGKIVMRAAAEHLSSVTLELGGKSPTIVDKSADVGLSAKRIAYGKYMNAGQICIAPDYVYVHEQVKEQFIKEMRHALQEMYEGAPQDSPAYGRIVSQSHADRLKSMIRESEVQGCEIYSEGLATNKGNYIAPTMVIDPALDSQLMQEEIFGPVLPVISYCTIDEVIKFINKKERPLALYIYARNKALIEKIMLSTRAGTSCVRQNNVQFFHAYLPFGGSNHSGIGKAHGHHGFLAFSNERAVLNQRYRGATDLLRPPYKGWKKKLVKWTVKWL